MTNHSGARRTGENDKKAIKEQMRMGGMKHRCQQDDNTVAEEGITLKFRRRGIQWTGNKSEERTSKEKTWTICTSQVKM